MEWMFEQSKLLPISRNVKIKENIMIEKIMKHDSKEKSPLYRDPRYRNNLGFSPQGAIVGFWFIIRPYFHLPYGVHRPFLR